MNTLVSVLMPVYNAEKYLVEAIDSILNQSYSDFEFLIINDGSTDRSEEIILSFSDPRIRYIKNEGNLKLIKTLNKGMQLCTGKYIVRMDADDISDPARIERQVSFMEHNPEVGLCGTWFASFDEKGKKGECRYAREHDEICFKQLYQIHLSHGTAIFRMSIINESDFRFDVDFPHAEDYDLFTRMSLKTRLTNLPFIGYHVRHHENEVSVKFSPIQKISSLKVRAALFTFLQTYNDDRVLTNFEKLNYQDYNEITLSSSEIKLLLESLVIGNKNAHYINESYFENKIKELWLNYCYHKANIDTYRKSKLLFSKDKLKKVNKIKWRIKSLLKN